MVSVEVLAPQPKKSKPVRTMESRSGAKKLDGFFKRFFIMNIVDQDQSKALPGISPDGIFTLFCFFQGLHNSSFQGSKGHQLLAYFRAQPERPYLPVVDAENEEAFFFNRVECRGFDEAHQDVGASVIVHIGGVKLVWGIGKYSLVEFFAGGIQKGEFETRAGSKPLEHGLALEI